MWVLWLTFSDCKKKKNQGRKRTRQESQKERTKVVKNKQTKTP
jgi:hypothetical protein